jgi:hypothetical protein
VKTTLDPTTVADIAAIPTGEKLFALVVAVAIIVGLVAAFKFKAAVPLAVMFAGVAYVDYEQSGVTWVGGLFAALTVGVLYLGARFNKGKGKSKGKGATPAAAGAR